MTAVAIGTAQIRILCDGHGELGILEFVEGRLKKGCTKPIIKKIGDIRTANVVILMVMNRFLKNDSDFGFFKYNMFTFRYRALHMEDQLKKMA